MASSSAISSGKEARRFRKTGATRLPRHSADARFSRCSAALWVDSARFQRRRTRVLRAATTTILQSRVARRTRRPPPGSAPACVKLKSGRTAPAMARLSPVDSLSRKFLAYLVLQVLPNQCLYRAVLYLRLTAGADGRQASNVPMQLMLAFGGSCALADAGDREARKPRQGLFIPQRGPFLFSNRASNHGAKFAYKNTPLGECAARVWRGRRNLRWHGIFLRKNSISLIQQPIF